MKQEELIFKLYGNREISSIYDQTVHCRLTSKIIEDISITEADIHFPYLIKDIPNYLELEHNFEGNKFRFKTISQYRGYLLHLSGFNSSDAYLEQQLSKRNRKNLISKKRKLEQNHQITYRLYYGNISMEEHKLIFSAFYHLLRRRFDQKKSLNRYLENWNELYNTVFDKILQKKASLFVIYNEANPIGITLNYHLGELILSHIQTYDVDYSEYNIGDILMLKHLEWCIDGQVAIYDLSMGESDFKSKWCNHSYLFDYQLIYQPNSISQRLMAVAMILKLKIKQFLRDMGIVGGIIQLDKLKYRKESKNIRLKPPV